MSLGPHRQVIYRTAFRKKNVLKHLILILVAIDRHRRLASGVLNHERGLSYPSGCDIMISTNKKRFCSRRLCARDGWIEVELELRGASGTVLDQSRRKHLRTVPRNFEPFEEDNT